MQYDIIKTALALALIAAPAAAQIAPVYDTPVKVITIPGRDAPPMSDAVTCTFYGDVMIRIYGTDTPAPDNALILPVSAGCGQNALSHGVVLQSGPFSLDGRKGDFLVFEATDPSGASAFIVFNVRNGHQLFQDGMGDITSVQLTNDICTCATSAPLTPPAHCCQTALAVGRNCWPVAWFPVAYSLGHLR